MILTLCVCVCVCVCVWCVCVCVCVCVCEGADCLAAIEACGPTESTPGQP